MSQPAPAPTPAIGKLTDKQQGYLMMIAFIIPPFTVWASSGFPTDTISVGLVAAGVLGGILAMGKEFGGKLTDQQQALFMLFTFAAPPIVVWLGKGFPTDKTSLGFVAAGTFSGILAYVKEALGSSPAPAPVAPAK